MGLDIRIPIGAMFALLGVILTAYGIFANPEIYSKSLDINVNLWWGLVMLAFGGLMLFMGRHGAPKAETSDDSPAAEDRE